MSTLTYAQLKGLWLQGSGGTRYHTNQWATTMAAIAEAESGGNTDALNPSDNNGTQSSFGLWQISSGTHAPPAANWADPSEQVKLAIGKLNGQGLAAWGTYNSGAYKAYMHGGTAPDPNIPGNPGGIQAQTLAAGTADCLVALTTFHDLPVIGHFFGAPCLVTKSNARAFLGAAFILAGGLVALPGILLLGTAAAVRAATPVLNAVNAVPIAGSYTRAAQASVTRRYSYTPPPKKKPAGKTEAS